MPSFIQDLRHGARSLRRSPGFTLATVLALALGIGANTMLFSVVSALLLRPLPLPGADKLLSVWGQDTQRTDRNTGLSRLDAEDLRQKVKSFDGFVAFDVNGVTLTGPNLEPERVEAAAVSEDFFRVAGVKPLLGRVLIDEEFLPNGARAVVISHGLWKRRFGADPRVLERMVEMEGNAYQVVGVMPQGFDFPREGASEPLGLWASLASQDFIRDNWDSRGTHLLVGMARLAPGATVEQANAEARSVMAALTQAYPDSNQRTSATVMGLQARLSQDTRRPALLLLGAVSLLLLIACVNVAQLLLARALARQQEFAVRTALGAGRLALARQLLAEGSLLAVTGGVLGLLLGTWGTDALSALLPESVQQVQTVSVDGLALVYTAGLVLAVALLCGLAPLGTAVKASLGGLLQSTRGTSASKSALRWRAVLVSTQVALALVLLVGAGLLVRSAQRLAAVDPGYRSENVTLMRYNLPAARYTGETMATFYARLLERVRAQAGVEAAAHVTPGVVTGGGISLTLDIPGRPTAPGEQQDTSYRAMSDGAFATLGIQLKRGRDFTTQDTLTSPPVVVVNESFARRFFPGEEVLGKRVMIGYGDKVEREVVGVVGDVRGRALDSPAEPELYAPLGQTPWPGTTLMVRSRLPMESVAAAVKAEMAQLDSQLSMRKPTTLEANLERSVADRNFQRVLLLAFAVSAVALASLGIYGLMAYSVAQRRRELGIRLALGAMPADVVRLVMRQALRMCAVGLGVGLLLALAMSQVLEGMLYDVSATDPLTFLAVPVLLLTVVALASWLPARRASKVSPGVAMSAD
ncbi:MULTISPECIES: ABC transporter permease [Myxococcus]|uniref:ABC transporter permease n=1 Tax=Myxococcus llanfairpwllgwyngyllgogerychwyrndrobwllllantysiliogogogochensis TaxID=2590453 RepID=A0A540X9A1_9BACT|nr:MULTISPECIES: ABC transporter permease [Myxococcus]NTX02583.1 ABC transporter permease [Myxococcus sp. CA040A]TQF17875.1 ABC transporter permease [Myxococcus llanfairpwllgwyngyllgogerychwyrndrobwllllantysiliogogogochensis]